METQLNWLIVITLLAPAPSTVKIKAKETEFVCNSYSRLTGLRNKLAKKTSTPRTNVRLTRLTTRMP